MLAKPARLADGGLEISRLEQWDIQADSLTLKGSPLFDWKTRQGFRSSLADGVYTSSFDLARKKKSARYFLDLGTVYFTAEVRVNGQAAGRRIYAPYQLDITPFVRTGPNQVEVRVTPTQLNGFIARAQKGDKRYSQFKGQTSQLMSAGLVGPVRILEK